MIEISAGTVETGGTRLTIYLPGIFDAGDLVSLWVNEARASLAVVSRDTEMGGGWERVWCRNSDRSRTVTRSTEASKPHVLVKSMALPDWVAPAGHMRRRAAEWCAIDGGVELSVDWPTVRGLEAREEARLDEALEMALAKPVGWRDRMRDAVAAVNRLAAEAPDGVVLAIDGGELVAKVRVVQEVEL